ncbi:MAG: hypothetical protein ABGY75_00860 [Gemmataceae bacterium]
MRNAILALATVVFGMGGAAFGQVPSGTTWTWKEVMQPKKHTSPTFAVSTTDNTKTTLTLAEGTLDFGPQGGKLYTVTEATLVVEVSGGQGIWNPAISENAAAQSPGANKWTLAGSQVGTLYQFDPTVDIRIEFRIKFKEVATPQNPNPPTLTATVGSKTQKPTVP